MLSPLPNGALRPSEAPPSAQGPAPMCHHVRAWGSTCECWRDTGPRLVASGLSRCRTAWFLSRRPAAAGDVPVPCSETGVRGAATGRSLSSRLLFCAFCMSVSWHVAKRPRAGLRPGPPAGRLRAVRPAVVGPGGWGSPCTGASEHQPAWSLPLGSGSSSRSGGGSWGSRQDAPQDRPEPSRPGAERGVSPRPCSPALGRHAAVLSWARSGSYRPARRRVKTAVGEGGVRVWRKALVAWPRGRPSAGPPGFTVLIWGRSKLVTLGATRPPRHPGSSEGLSHRPWLSKR